MSELGAMSGNAAVIDRTVVAHEFFGGGDRQSHLDQLRHLSRWSRRLLLITGPLGVGKSTLYRELCASLEPGAEAARLDAAGGGSVDDVLSALLHGLGLAVPPEADVRLRTGLIADHAESLEQGERTCVVLIDNAEMLEPAALTELVELAAASPLRIVLFGEVPMVNAVDRAAEASGIGWYEIRLGGFPLVDARDYLEWRFRTRGYAGELPFSDAQVKEIVRLSEGLPGRMDQMASVLLAKIRAEGATAGLRRFPTRHLVVVGVLLAGVVLAYVVLRPAEEAPPADWAAVERIDVPPAAARRDAELRDAAPRDAAPPDAAPPADPEPAPSPAEVAEPEASDVAAREPRPSDAAPIDTDPTATAGEAPLAAAAESAPAPAPVVPERVAPEPIVQEPVVAEPAAPQPVPSEPAAAEPVAPERIAAEPVAPEPASAADATVAAARTEGARNAAWVMGQPPTAYTLQLMSLSTPERAEEFVARQAEPLDFARFRQQRSGQILHVIIYGTYPTRAAAEQAAAALPPEVGDIEPWIRSYAQVQAAARTALQQTR